MIDTTPASAATPVPFLDLGLSHSDLKADILEDISKLIDSNAFTNGPAVGQFEEAFAAYCGSSDCVGMASGLDALRLALEALDLEPGAEVIVPASTFIATFEAVTQAGAVPVPAEVDKRDYTLDPAAAAAAVTDRTRAIMPVHLYGQRLGHLSASASGSAVPVAGPSSKTRARRTAPSAMALGRRARDCHRLQLLSGKNLGAFGDAGALVTDDEALAARVRALREHGQRRKYEHDAIGYTARLDTIQAIVLLRKLPLLAEWNDARRAAARFYTEALVGLGDLVLPYVPEASKPVWHLYVVRSAHRDALADWLRSREIGVGPTIRSLCTSRPAYALLGYGRARSR